MCEGVDFSSFSFGLSCVAWGTCVSGGLCFLIFQIYILVLCVVRDCFLVDRQTLSLGSSFENKGFALISRMIEMASKKF